jgi:DNA replication regulator SLD3
MLLPRDQLPLSALDLGQPHGDLPTTRFFESKIKILDLEGRLGSNVLLARSETTRVAYAVEREAAGLYVVCKLGPWVDLNKLGQGATVVCSERMRAPRPAAPSSSTVPGALVTPFLHKEAKKRRLVIDEIQSMVRRRSIASKEPPSRPSTPGTAAPTSEGPVLGSNGAAAPSESGIQPLVNHTLLGDEEPGSQALPFLEDNPVQPTADDIFQNIRAQYIEALYHSMVGRVLGFVVPRAHFSRDHWRILQKALCPEPGLPFTWTVTPILRWAI